MDGWWMGRGRRKEGRENEWNEREWENERTRMQEHWGALMVYMRLRGERGACVCAHLGMGDWTLGAVGDRATRALGVGRAAGHKIRRKNKIVIKNHTPQTTGQPCSTAGPQNVPPQRPDGSDWPRLAKHSDSHVLLCGFTRLDVCDLWSVSRTTSLAATSCGTQKPTAAKTQDPRAPRLPRLWL